MAERRMFAKKICMSDDFLDMPITARCLYFTLGLLADDDGFIDNTKAIMRQCGASKNDLDMLLVKQYVLAFEDGVLVIRHWHLHNYLRSDRYHETQYTDHKAELVNGSRGYERLPNGIPLVDGMDTEDRIGKDRLGEERLGKDRLEDKDVAASGKQHCPFTEIMDLYHSICKSYPKLVSMEGKRRTAVQARWRTWQSLDTFRQLFEKAEASSFMKGENDRNWHATFDWMVNAGNAAKILEGNFDGRKSGRTDTTKGSGAMSTLQKLYDEAKDETE